MGNSVGGRKKVKIMKIDGETIKLKPPVQARDVLKDYPAGYVLLDSDSVRHFGIRASPLDPDRELKAKKLYFLVELPSFPEDNPAAPRRVRSGIQMSAKDRLECLMLSRRSVSDLTMARPRAVEGNGSETLMQVKMKIPRAELERVVGESRDKVEIARKIVDLYYMGNANGGGEISDGRTFKPQQKQVSFSPMEEELGLGLSSW
ncbi:hypothetical protein MLD38_001219 [Melastoma candidum]|uniref:Uncharacterized protein n=1 Tax=Melastoma candidum TaxID=119954 RepID=A0ACB9SCI7_9MYRT|nr:hypothetical protein MLD38_001219 [Melastoma candidum]